MEVKNLLGKLQGDEAQKSNVDQPRVPTPPTPRTPQTPKIEEQVPRTTSVVQQNHIGGSHNMREDIEEGIILDLGEGISLNIPIQRRMSLSDFIKLAEKVKALEMLSEGSEKFERPQF